MLRRINIPFRMSRGMTLVEVTISLALMLLLSIITIGGMIMHARMAKSNLTQQQIAENSRRFLDLIQISALDATDLRVATGPSGAGTVFTAERPDPNNVGSVLIDQFAYIDADNDPNTIDDNTIVHRNVDTPGATTGKELIQYCSLVSATTPVFTDVAGSAVPVPGATAPARPLFDINLRVGDRSTTSGAYNHLTGPGYQTFVISSSVSQL